MIRLLFNSSRQKGRLAFDSADGHTLSSGQRLSVKQGDFWIPGMVESDGLAYMLIPDAGGWQARIDLRPGMVVQDENDSVERESEGEPMAINQNSNEAMAALYGPAAAHSEHTRFTRVKYRENERTKTGLIIWICAATKDSPMLYVVEGGGFPDLVAGGDITGIAEDI